MLIVNKDNLLTGPPIDLDVANRSYFSYQGAAPAAPAKQSPPVMFNCNACACGDGHHPVGSLIAPADTYIVPALVAAAVGAAVRSDCLVMAGTLCMGWVPPIRCAAG